MNVIPKDLAAAGFDEATWHEELLALNPWARGLTIDEENAEFTAARQKATLARHAEGKERWNVWANGMLALKAALEAAGQWAAKREHSWAPLAGENQITQAWLAPASAVFSTQATPHRFETDVSFDEFAFPGVTRFEHATFSGAVRFRGATFSDAARFEDATFSGEARFDAATFSRQARFVGATFRGRALLKRGRFEATANFRQAKFEEPATFEMSVFQESAYFEGADSVAAFSLADATFHQVPSFIGATFKGTLRLDNVNVEMNPSRFSWLKFGYTPDKDATARFRELKRRAVDAQDRDRELEFFAQEIRTRRFHSKGLRVPSWVRMVLRLPSWVPEVLRPPSWVPRVWSLSFWLGLGFGTLSNFGRSLWRPFLTWPVLLLGFAAFFLGEMTIYARRAPRSRRPANGARSAPTPSPPRALGTIRRSAVSGDANPSPPPMLSPRPCCSRSRTPWWSMSGPPIRRGAPSAASTAWRATSRSSPPGSPPPRPCRPWPAAS